MRRRPSIPETIESHRDECWRREGTRQVETAFDAERFIEEVGCTACLTDSRRPGPSLYVAVCGRGACTLVLARSRPTRSLVTFAERAVLDAGRRVLGAFDGPVGADGTVTPVQTVYETRYRREGRIIYERAFRFD